MKGLYRDVNSIMESQIDKTMAKQKKITGLCWDYKEQPKLSTPEPRNQGIG